MRRASLDDAKILADIYGESMKFLNGYTIRDQEYFKKFIMEIESENGRIYINEENNNKSYIAYYIQGDTFFVRELIYNSVSSLKCVLAYIYNHNTQCKRTVINSPVDDKIRLVVENLKTFKIKLVPFMAGRMINFKKYLETLNLDNEKIKKIEGKFISIKVKDKYIKQNDGVFKISIVNSKINVEKVDEGYDIELNINSIAQLAFSYLNIEEILMLNEIEESSLNYEQKSILNTLFEKKVNYIDELV
ncbi:MAG: sterol carrier protein domain-containing protein [Intestinibacter sp.]